MSEYRCFFCNEKDEATALCEAKTFALDVHVREAAILTQDTCLLAKLSAGDMVALEELTLELYSTCLMQFGKVMNLS